MTTASSPAVEARVDRLHAHGMVDMHFDMLMDLYDKRERAGVLEADYLPEPEQGGVGILGAASRARPDRAAVCRGRMTVRQHQREGWIV
jgi:hypothetical protein